MVNWPQLLECQYPFENHYHNLDGIRYHYVDEGQGHPVVMVHGNPTWSFYYRRLILSLRDNYRCIAPDHIGCGLSDKPDDPDYDYHFEQRTADLEQLLDSLGIQSKITLVVHDWGGMIGMLYAARNPERIARIIVLNTGAFHLPPSKKLPLALALGRKTRLGAFLIQRLNMFSLCAAYVGCKRERLQGPERWGYLAPYDNYNNRRAVLRFVQDIPLSPSDRGYDTISEIESMLHQFQDIPVQMFWGEQDFVFDNSFRDRWIHHLPNAEVHSFADCGHYILEDAWTDIEPKIHEFLKANPIDKEQ